MKGSDQMTKEKPELGCKPYYVASGQRVYDLAAAITRYAENIDTEHEKIREWAEEIKMHCDIAKKFDN